MTRAAGLIREAAERIAADTSARVLADVAAVYPEEMRAASGGFRQTMRLTMVRQVSAALADWMLADAEARASMEGKPAGQTSADFGQT